MKFFYSLKSSLQTHPYFSKQKKDVTPRDLLIEDILKTQHALETAYAGFDNATDPDLIDCYIYEVNSALKRYRFLLNQANRMEIVLNDTCEVPFISQPMPGSLS